MICRQSRSVALHFGLVVAIGLSLAVAATGLSTSPSPSNPQVLLHACDATVVGTWTVVNSSIATANVRQFQGIPFAQAPIGTLRFSPPTEVSCPGKSGSVFEATSFSQPCIQQVDGNLTVGDEDCLYLNVYVPEVLNTTATQRAPVLVYIHGGGLTGGSAIWEPLQFLSAFAGGDDTKSTAENAAVVVTINYRLGVLGFLTTKEMCAEHRQCGNYGIMDQIAALKWVRTNIASFGGDPNRVNIMGQSSGGTSVFALMGTPSASGLFQSGISLSGSPNITIDKAAKLSQDVPIVQSLGCEGKFVLSCLRKLPATTVQVAIPNSWNTPALFSNRFLNNASQAGEAYAALVYVDGELIPKPIWTSVLEGLNNNVTLVFGNMGQERNLVTPTVPVANLTTAQYAEFVTANIVETWPNPALVSSQLMLLYSNATAVNPQIAYDSLNADYGLSCATFSLTPKLRAAFSPASPRPAPVYSYIHQWGPSNVTLDPSLGNVMQYAFHTWDYVNAVHNWADFYTPVAGDYVLSRLQRSQWYQIWTQKHFQPSTEWPSLLDGSAPMMFLFSRTDRYPFRPMGATPDPYTSPGVCDYLVNELGLDQRYWWCN